MSTSQMIEILGRLRKQMNGEVSERMAAHGVEYALNYGVAIHSIREIARDYAPDTKLARLLYSQQVRDLQIAACCIADPSDVTWVDEAFWRGGVATGEMAEQLSGLLAKSADTQSYVEGWLSSDDSNVRYCALLTAAKSRSESNARRVAEWIATRGEISMSETEIRVVATILSSHYQEPRVGEVIRHIKDSNLAIHKRISEELYVFDE